MSVAREEDGRLRLTFKTQEQSNGLLKAQNFHCIAAALAGKHVLSCGGDCLKQLLSVSLFISLELTLPQSREG